MTSLFLCGFNVIMKKYLSATKFSKIIGKDPKTVISWVEQGLIPDAKRVGHFYQIPSKQIKVYQQSSVYPNKEWQK